MITAKSIHKKYNSLEVLKGIDLHVSKGEVVSIVGASGAGKSTLLHIIGTLDKADSGSVTILDTDVGGLSSSQLARFRNKNIGFVFQSHHLLPEFSAMENVMMPALIAGAGKKTAEMKALELLEMMRIRERKEHRPSELSGGEQQRVAVARALINEPFLLLADEPSGNLDSASARSLHELFFSIRDQKKITFVIVTHNEELASMADRKLIMKDGLIA